MLQTFNGNRQINSGYINRCQRNMRVYRFFNITRLERCLKAINDFSIHRMRPLLTSRFEAVEQVTRHAESDGNAAIVRHRGI